MTKIFLIKERLRANDCLPVRWIVRSAFTSEFNARSYAHAVCFDDHRAVLTLEQWDGTSGQYEKELELAS